MIPPFDKHGNLPPGEHPTTWEMLEIRYATTVRRIHLLTGLRAALEALRQVGCRTVWIDGSFISSKTDPNDIDVLFDDAHLDWEELSLNEPVLLDHKNKSAAMKRKFGCECYAVSWLAGMDGEPFLEFFQHTRDGQRKGILRLDLSLLEEVIL